MGSWNKEVRGIYIGSGKLLEHLWPSVKQGHIVLSPYLCFYLGVCLYSSLRSFEGMGSPESRFLETMHFQAALHKMGVFGILPLPFLGSISDFRGWILKDARGNG